MKTPLIFLAVVATGFAADALAPKAEAIAKSYSKALTRLTEKPKSISAELAAFCRSVPSDKTAGPHSRHYVNYFCDDLAQRPGEKFEAGSVIVKEKLAGIVGKDLAIQAVAGMIKRPAGTLPKSGDWEFFWFDEGKVTTRGMEGCAGCHSGAKKDYVFTDFPKKVGK